MAEEKKEKPEAVPLGETEAIDELTKPEVPENLPDASWSFEDLIEAVTKDSNMLVRSNAVNALARKGGPESVDPLIMALKDPEDVVKANAIVGLRHLGKDLVQESMAKALTESEHDEIRAGAAWVLGEMIDEKAIDLLKKAAEEDESPMVRVHAKASLIAHEKSSAEAKPETEKKE